MNVSTKTVLTKTASVLLLLMLIFSLSACSGGMLDGTYISESGEYEIEFEKDGTCVWIQGGRFFDGTYEETKDGYRLMIMGNGLAVNTVFDAVWDGKDLIITGGRVDGERFVKQ